MPRSSTVSWGSLVAALAISQVVYPQEPETVLIRRVVPTNFRDVQFDASKLESLLSRSVNRVVTVRPQATLSDILKEQFNISQTWTPATYRRALEHVLQTNGLNQPAELKAGQVLKLPDLPRTAQILYAPQTLPVPQARTSITTTWEHDLAAVGDRPMVGSQVSATAKAELQVRAVSASYLESLTLPKANMSREEMIENNDYQVMQERMEITYAQSPAGGTSQYFLNAKDQEVLSRFLSRPARTKPLLVVLDDGFPSQDDFWRSARFVIDASREIRRKFGLQDAAHGDSVSLLALEKNYQQGTLFCDSDCEWPKLKMHSAMIRESMADMMSADAQGRVQVLYLPLNFSQVFSKEMLTEILRVTLLADSVTDGLVLKAPGIPEQPDMVRGTPDFAGVEGQLDKLVGSSSLRGTLKAYDGKELTAQTDRAVIDGIVNFLWLYSMASQRPHFLSMSWTARNLKYPVLFRSNGYGMLLAAAGNNPDINIHSALRQFAARSSDPGDVIAVRNVSAACGSSSFTSNSSVQVLGFAFPGRISPSNCGTSFSTPRLAWLLAAFEAIKGAPVVPYSEQWNTWRAVRKNNLLDLQNRNQEGEGRYAVSVWRLLGEPPP